MEILARQREHSYIKLFDPKEVDRYKIDEPGGERLSFLKELGIVSYRNTFKAWLRKFPRPILIFCVKDRSVVAWVYVEEWDSPARDGEPVYVLRSIETSKELRKKKIGYRLLLLSVRETPGYLITKPINPGARKFFFSHGFIDKDDLSRPPIDLQRNPGYLILPPFKKNLLMTDIEDYFEELK